MIVDSEQLLCVFDGIILTKLAASGVSSDNYSTSYSKVPEDLEMPLAIQIGVRTPEVTRIVLLGTLPPNEQGHIPVHFQLGVQSAGPRPKVTYHLNQRMNINVAIHERCENQVNTLVDVLLNYVVHGTPLDPDAFNAQEDAKEAVKH